MTFVFLLNLFLLSLPFSGWAREVPGTKGPVVGEKLTYILRWGLIPVGWTTMNVKAIEKYQGRDVYHVVVRAWSNAFLSTFYKLEDRIETYMDVEGLYSRRFYKKQSEGGYQADEEMVYDHQNHRARYQSFRNGSTKEMEIPPKVQDVLSAIYYFRTLPLKVGQSVFINVNADEKNWKLEIQVLDFKKGMEVRRMGVFDAFYVEPLARFKGVFERRGRVWVWISADRRRLPLVVKSKVPFGSVTATLVKVEMVKNSA